MYSDTLSRSPFEITLRRPDAKYRDTFLAGLNELKDAHEIFSWTYEPLKIFDPRADFAAFAEELRRRETVAPGKLVTDDIYWAFHNEEMVGRISLRHKLNEFLSRIGGNVGYIVRPSARRQGVATEMLRLVLKTERAVSLGKVLVTCDDRNTASRKTIEKNGGVAAGFVWDDETKKDAKTLHFWIDTSSRAKL